MNQTIKNFIDACDFGESVFNDYYGPSNVDGYEIDLKRHTTAKNEAKKLFKALEPITANEFILASKQAFSGRIEFDIVSNSIHYTAGQFGTLEEPQAMLAVLERVLTNRK